MNSSQRVLQLRTIFIHFPLFNFEGTNPFSYFCYAKNLCARDSSFIADTAFSGVSTRSSAVDDLHDVRLIRSVLVGAVDHGDLAASLAKLLLLGEVDNLTNDGVSIRV